LARRRPLEHQPFQDLDASARVHGPKEARGLFREIDEDRTGLKNAHRLAVWSFGVNDRRDLVIGADVLEFGIKLFALADIHGVEIIRQVQLFQNDRDLASIRGVPAVKIDHGVTS